MQPHPRMLSVFTVGAAMLFGAVVMAADLPKEGAYKGTYAGVGTIKINSMGKDRVFMVFDETGLERTDGFFDHTTWHCWGMGDYTNGLGEDHARCIATDLAGDKLAQEIVSEKHAMDQKTWKVSARCVGGTGKYAGVSCDETDIIQGNEFPSAPEGSYVVWVTLEGNYKLK